VLAVAKKRKRAHDGDGHESREGKYYVWRARVGKRNFVVRRTDYTEFRNEVARRKLEVEALKAKAGDVSRDTLLEDWIPRWIEAEIAPPKRARKTHRNYLADWERRIAPHLGKKKLGRLNRTHVADWHRALMDGGASARVANMALVVLRRGLEAARDAGYLGTNPAATVEAAKEEEPKMRVLPPGGARELVCEAYRPSWTRPRPPRVRHQIRFMLSTGVRPSEALGLRWCDVDLEEGLVHLRVQLDWESAQKWRLAPLKSKNAKRTLVLRPDAVKALRHARALQTRDRVIAEDYEDHGLVFATVRGTPISPRNFAHDLECVLARTTLPYVSPHDLRRTCLTELADRGMPMHQLQKYAGHASITTTAKYYLASEIATQRIAIEGLRPAHEGSSAKATKKATKGRAVKGEKRVWKVKPGEV
jgi:integrase